MHRGHQWGIGLPLYRDAPANQNPGTAGAPAQYSLSDQPRLTHPGTSADQRHTRVPITQDRCEFAERIQLVIAPDQARAGDAGSTSRSHKPSVVQRSAAQGSTSTAPSCLARIGR